MPVPNIIFSLWKIPDKQTSRLMIDFYREMLSGKSYSESLRAAKLKLIKDPANSRPRSWLALSWLAPIEYRPLESTSIKFNIR